MEIIAELKEEFIRGYSNRLWEFSFVHTWPTADGVPDEEKTSEKERFAKTFWEVSERQKSEADTAAVDADSGGDFASLLQFALEGEEKPLFNKEERAALQKKLEKKKHKKKEAKKQRQKQRQSRKKRKK